MPNEIKRVPIKKRIRALVFRATSISVIAIALAALIFMFRIRGRSEKYILNNIESSILDSMDDVAMMTEMQLEEYSDCVKESATFIESLYNEKEKFTKRSTETYLEKTDYQYYFRKYLLNENVNEESLKDEMELLANVESYWKPILKHDNDNITALYLGTESGFLISFSKHNLNYDLSNLNTDYFNFFDRPWYEEAKKKNELVFIEIGEDYFGRGLMLTCAKPFYGNGEFKGIVALDILVTDLQENILAIEAEGEGTYSFAVNKKGEVIVAPENIIENSQFKNITDENNPISQISENILSGSSGIELVNDIYYAYAPLDNVGLIMCVRLPRSIILQYLKRIDQGIISIILVFIVIAIIIRAVVYFRTTKLADDLTYPIEELKKDVEIISKGSLNYKAKVIGNDEISDLAISFNSMTESLKKHIDDVTKLTAEKEKERVELKIATNIQVGMLPTKFPAFPDDNRFDIFATMTPAKEVGGDFYDMFKIDENHLAIVVADVSGKGIPAALFMAIGKSLIKDHTYYSGDLSEVFNTVNNILCNSNKEDMFITAFEGIIDLNTGMMKYVNAGHELPFIYRNGKGFSPYEMKPRFVLGGMKDIKYTVSEIKLEKGDIFYEYTDGVAEATNINNELYGMERLEKALNKNINKSVESLLHSVKEDIDLFVGEAPQFDDITMIGFKYY